MGDGLIWIGDPNRMAAAAAAMATDGGCGLGRIAREIGGWEGGGGELLTAALACRRVDVQRRQLLMCGPGKLQTCALM